MILIFIVIIITLCAATRLPTCYNLHHASRDGNGSPCVDPSDRILEWLHQIESMSRMIYFVKKQRVLLPIGTCMHHHHHILFMDKCIYQLIFITYSPQHHVGSVLFSSSLDLVIMKKWKTEGGLWKCCWVLCWATSYLHLSVTHMMYAHRHGYTSFLQRSCTWHDLLSVIHVCYVSSFSISF